MHARISGQSSLLARHHLLPFNIIERTARRESQSCMNRYITGQYTFHVRMRRGPGTTRGGLN